jgi:hypothetical protein
MIRRAREAAIPEDPRNLPLFSFREVQSLESIPKFDILSDM